jgi:restriction endonuclease S subunit
LKQTVTRCQNGAWGSDPCGTEDDVICVRVADFDRQRFRVSLADPTLRAVAAGTRQTLGLQRGDLLLEKSGGGNTQPVGAVVLYDHDTPAICSNYIARMAVAPGFDPAFVCYLHAALYALRINCRSIHQTTGIQNLDAGAYLSEWVRLPGFAEQRTIAQAVERQTVAIDTLASAKQRLLDLLMEKRRALINQAFNLRPEHRLSRFKYIRSGAIQYGAAEPAAAADRSCPRYIRITDLNHDGSLRPETFQSLPDELARPYILEDGDILFARSGATVGKAFRYRAEWGSACFAGYLVRLRPQRSKVLPDYLYYFTQSHAFDEQVRAGAVQATILNLNAERYANFSIPLPQLEEQQAVVDSLDAETGTIGRIAAGIRSQIELLREYREVLICAAVTRGLDAITADAICETATAG